MSRIKTSTKILLSLAAAALILCVVNAFVSITQNKKYKAEAGRVLELLDAEPVKTFDVTLAPEIKSDAEDGIRSYLRYLATSDTRYSDRQGLNVPASILKNVSAQGGTLYLNHYGEGGRTLSWGILQKTPSLETIIIRKAGMADEILTVAAVTEPAAEPESHAVGTTGD